MDKIKTASALTLILFINFIFSVKYLSRVTPYYLLFSFVIVAFYCVLWKYQMQLKNILFKFKYLDVWLVIGFIIISSFVFIKIPPESLNVDRWSVISSFWESYFSGDYVYYAKSFDGNQPGPMPFYFFMALPFYWMGELGYYSISGIIIFLLVMKYSSVSLQNQYFYLLMLFSFTFMLWEVICRSNLFLNGSLILLSIIYLFQSLKDKKSNRFLWNGLFIGLMLSTRNVFIIPYIITFLFALKQNKISIKNTFIIGLIAIITFGATFIPFIYNHFNDFKKMNPFIIQSNFLMPTKYSLLCVLFSTLTFFTLRKKSDVYFYSGFLLFITIITYFVYHIIENNFHETFFNSGADISYFILCIPFLLYFIIERESTDFPKSN